MSVGPGRGVDYPGTWLRNVKLKDAAGPPKMVRSQMLSPNEQLRDPDLSKDYYSLLKKTHYTYAILANRARNGLVYRKMESIA